MKLACAAVALLCLIQVALGLAVSACRWRYRLSVGRPPERDHPMNRVCTAFDNCAQWHPPLMALLLIIPIVGAPKAAIWLNSLSLAARCLAVMGLVCFSLKKPNIFRFLGQSMTYTMVLLMSGWILFSYF